MLMANQAPPYAATGQNVSRTGNATSPADARAQFRLNSNGEAESAPTSGTFTSEFTWKAPWALAADYECLVTVNSGSFTSGTLTAQALGTTRTWIRERTSNVDGTDTVNATVTIRHIATGLVVATFTLILAASVAV